MIWNIPQRKTGKLIDCINTARKSIFIHWNNLLLRVILNFATFLLKAQPYRLLLLPLFNIFQHFLWHLFPIYSSTIKISVEYNPSRGPLNPQYLGCMSQALSPLQYQPHQLHPLLHINLYTCTEILEYLFFLRAIFSRLNIEYNNCRIRTYNFYATYYEYQHFNHSESTHFQFLLLVHANLSEKNRNWKLVRFFRKKFKITFLFFFLRILLQNRQIDEYPTQEQVKQCPKQQIPTYKKQTYEKKIISKSILPYIMLIELFQSLKESKDIHLIQIIIALLILPPLSKLHNNFIIYRINKMVYIKRYIKFGIR